MFSSASVTHLANRQSVHLHISRSLWGAVILVSSMYLSLSPSLEVKCLIAACFQSILVPQECVSAAGAHKYVPLAGTVTVG